MARPLHRQRGQGLIEFAVVFPFFVFLLMAIIDGGLLMGRYGSVNNAANEGARRGAVGASRDEMVAVIKAQVHGILPSSTTIGCGASYTSADNAICIEWIAGPGSETPGDFGSAVRVKVKYRYPILNKMFSLFGVANPVWHVKACGVARLEKLITDEERSDAAFGYTAGTGDSCA